MNVWDIVVLAMIGAGVYLAVRRARKTGKSGGCSCGCEGCRRPCAGKDRDTGKEQ